VNVTALSVTPIKGTRLQRVQEVALGPDGARGNRRFFLIDERGRMINAKSLGELQTIVAECVDNVLTLTFPDGQSISGPVNTREEPIAVRFFSITVRARPVDGPFAEALSEHLGRPIRVMESLIGAVDRGRRGGVSLISRASLERLEQAAGETEIDARRFRMLIEVDGLDAHEEDGWVGHVVQVGEAEVRFRGHVGRCLITSRDPDTGQVTLPTLDILGEYRKDLQTTEPLPFGIYGEVLRERAVRVGDAVKPRQ
jgi:uncharacterized protein YcbX